MLTTMMRCLAILLITAGVTRSSIVDYEDQDGIIVLTESNFDKAVEEFKYLFVDFYAPWCSHCKGLMPEYEKAAQILEDSGSEIRLAKVDATVEKALARKYEVRGYPTLKFFRHGSAPVTSKVGHTATEIVTWLKKKTGSAVERLDSVKGAKELIDKEEVVVFGFFKKSDSPAAKAYIEAADAVDDLTFAMTDKDELFKEFSVTGDTVTVFQKFDDGRVDLSGADQLTTQSIKDLVEHNRLPLVVEFSDETAPKVFSRAQRKHLLMFMSKDSSRLDVKLQEFRTTAAKFKGKLLCIFVDVDPDDHKRVLDFFGLKRSDCPTYRLIDLAGNVKYKPDVDEPTADHLEQFIDDILSGKRKPHLMSEDIPEDWDAKPVKELVGLNFEEVAKDKTKDVLVEFYAPWCGHCKELAPTWEELGEKYKDREDVVIAKLDATSNEVNGVKVTFFPTIKLYPKNSDEVFDFPRVNKTLDRLITFLETGGQRTEAQTEEVEETKTEETKKEEL